MRNKIIIQMIMSLFVLYVPIHVKNVHSDIFICLLINNTSPVIRVTIKRGVMAEREHVPVDKNLIPSNLFSRLKGWFMRDTSMRRNKISFLILPNEINW
jgi:hypothetical protein